MKKICILGPGYIGLPTGAILANKGFEVIGVDINPELVKRLNSKDIESPEPGLAKFVKSAINSGNFKAQTIPEEADVFMICVPTPLTNENKVDLTYVKSAAKNILPYLRKDNLIILESTVPPGTTKEVLKPILEKSSLKVGKDLYLAYCPERVIPGKILKEIVHNDRIIGGINPESAKLAKEVYQSFVQGKIYLTDATTAEMIKLTENSFRDVNIAFANELSRICGKLNLNVWEVIKLANKHPRVNILKPGPGVGGHCIAVDPWFIVEKVPDETKLIKTARSVNDSIPDYIVKKVETALKKVKVDNPLIACLGMTYKANVDDIRESPALKIIKKLKEKGYLVRVYDPYVKNFTEFPLFSLKEVAKGADCLLLLVDHKEFVEIGPDEFLKEMRHKIIIDTRGVWKSYEYTS